MAVCVSGSLSLCACRMCVFVSECKCLFGSLCVSVCLDSSVCIRRLRLGVYGLKDDFHRYIVHKFRLKDETYYGQN